MILEVVISLLAVAGFAVALWWGRIVPVARDALKVTMLPTSTLGAKGPVRKIPSESVPDEAIARFALIHTSKEASDIPTARSGLQ